MKGVLFSPAWTQRWQVTVMRLTCDLAKCYQIKEEEEKADTILFIGKQALISLV